MKCGCVLFGVCFVWIGDDCLFFYEMLNLIAIDLRHDGTIIVKDSP